MGAGYASQFTRNTAKVGELTISYLKGGRGRPLLYLHGLGGWGRWESYHMAMGITNLVYAPQLPGWPDGQIPASVTSVRDYAHLMRQFLDAIEVNTVDLVGHSFGGWVALSLSVEYPQRIAKLVLIDAMVLDVPVVPAANLEAMPEEAFLRAAFAQTGEVVIRGDFGGVREDVRQGQEFHRQWKSREIVARLVRGQYADPKLTQKVNAIATDTLIIWGREDGVVSWQHGEVLAATMPHARLAVIADAGHTPMREKRETFQRLLHNFLIGQEEGVEREGVGKY
ncbi:MAG: alpha/beta hydrolase [Deltaproteobacteria bacterium]|nr:alpha/beta hydrolase [Deltaproteobacteria bacterium]